MKQAEVDFREIAEKLWSLLDDIDTASDMFKPCERNGIKSYENFYSYSLKKASKRFELLASDGYKLYTLDEFMRRPPDKNGNLEEAYCDKTAAIPSPPLTRIMIECVVSTCPICHSSAVKKPWLIGDKFCINEDCHHYDHPIK